MEESRSSSYRQVRAHFERALLEHGFEKREICWIRRHGDVIQMVDWAKLPKDRMRIDGSEPLAFIDIAFGLYSSELAAVYHQRPEVIHPGVSQFLVRLQDMGGLGQRLYEMRAETSAEIATRLPQDLATGLDTYDQIVTCNELITLILRSEPRNLRSYDLTLWAIPVMLGRIDPTEWPLDAFLRDFHKRHHPVRQAYQMLADEAAE